MKIRTDVLLTIITGKLLCELEDLYPALSAMTGGDVYTHQLGIAMNRVRPRVMALFPELWEVVPLGINSRTASVWMVENRVMLDEERELPDAPLAQPMPSPFYGLPADMDVAVVAMEAVE